MKSLKIKKKQVQIIHVMGDLEESTTGEDEWYEIDFQPYGHEAVKLREYIDDNGDTHDIPYGPASYQCSRQFRTAEEAEAVKDIFVDGLNAYRLMLEDRLTAAEVWE
jgi:hypothetical protein